MKSRLIEALVSSLVAVAVVTAGLLIARYTGWPIRLLAASLLCLVTTILTIPRYRFMRHSQKVVCIATIVAAAIVMIFEIVGLFTGWRYPSAVPMVLFGGVALFYWYLEKTQVAK